MAVIETKTYATVERYIYHCKAHKFHKALDVDVDTTVTVTNLYGRINRQTRKLYNGAFTPPIVKCPDCKVGLENITGKPIKGYTTDHVCDAKCVSATRHICECSCGGANHGSHWL